MLDSKVNLEILNKNAIQTLGIFSTVNRYITSGFTCHLKKGTLLNFRNQRIHFPKPATSKKATNIDQRQNKSSMFKELIPLKSEGTHFGDTGYIC